VVGCQFEFHTPATYLMIKITEFHHYVVGIIIFVVVAVTYLLLFSTGKFKGNQLHRTTTALIAFIKNNAYSILLEIVWTVIPSILLVFLAAPTFLGLYAFEKGHNVGTDDTFKILGNQWYWDYEYSDKEDITQGSVLEVDAKKHTYSSAKSANNLIAQHWIAPEYPSYMVATDDLYLGDLRLLEADSSLFVPVEKQIRFIITSNDVIHCFAVPALGIKLDAIPGRLNQVLCVIKRIGNFYGQCSEICGIEHGFMPINLTVY
jgi:cytochrome c oxidase subunit II